jgi:alpha-glucosidase
VRDWWQGAVGYQIYVRSFADSDGDGIGDLPGARERLPYLADLGVDVVWLTPFYPSPQADHGYDVADYLGVDPVFGSLEDVEGFVADAHGLGLRVLIDLVPNHTSDRHPWFVDARSSRDATRREWYVWRDPAPDGGPPNNWVSHFGGPAWTHDGTTGQYYLHLFLPEQPDLNWEHPEVRAAFRRILQWWFDRGVDGFRVDVAHALVKDPGLGDNPWVDGEPPTGASPQEVFAALEHAHDLDQPGVLDIYREWHRIADRYDAVLVGEVYLLEPETLTRYVEHGDGLDAAFCFPVLKVDWDADRIRSILERSVTAGAGRLVWPLSSHDDPRAPTRFGGGERGARRSLAYLALLCGLPGVPFIYQGDELGLENGEVEAGADPIAVRNPGATGRDGARTPMVWAPGEGYGFTSGEPWLPFGRNRHDGVTALAQDRVPGSHLNRVRRLLSCRRQLAPLLDDTPAEWLDTDGDLVAFRRRDIVVACNVGAGGAVLRLPGPAEVFHATADGTEVTDDGLVLPADTTAYVRLQQ